MTGGLTARFAMFVIDEFKELLLVHQKAGNYLDSIMRNCLSSVMLCIKS